MQVAQVHVPAPGRGGGLVIDPFYWKDMDNSLELSMVRSQNAGTASNWRIRYALVVLHVRRDSRPDLRYQSIPHH
jgi:hypothetical protein